MKTLHIQDNIVTNISVGIPQSEPPLGIEYEVVEDSFYVGVGWIKEGDIFVDPNPPVIPEPEPIPNWEVFNITLLTNPLWVNWSLNPDLRTAIISASTTSNLAALQSAYNIAKVLTPNPPEGAIEEWQAIADENHIGIIF